jgi:hypothetical protein
MAYHISLVRNMNVSNDAVIANPVSQRDTYFVGKGTYNKPDKKVLISKGNWQSYDEAFPNANFIFTGPLTYCFWDTGQSQIAAVTEQTPTKVQLIYVGTAGDHMLVINSDATIAFTRA